MIKKNRDSKFVIYQVLYIFVITVLALKGADLNLREVVSRDQAVDKSVRDSLITVIDSLYAKGLDFEIKVDPNIAVENVKLKEKLASLNSKVSELSKKVKEIPPEKKPEKEKEQTIAQSPISIKQTFIQHTWNVAKNSGNIVSSIYDPKNLDKPIVTIPPGEQRKFDLTDQTEVIVKYGSQSDRISVVTNKPPKIKIERTTTKMNSNEIFVKDLQKITSFIVTISDERPEQLKVAYSGPISVVGPTKDEKGNLVYNVSLRIASTEAQFDQWLDRFDDLREPDGKYKVNFFFTVVDTITKDRIQVGDSFYFTDYSK